ncbi:MAG: DUF6318 family protein [Actinomycetaceae bacterium]|nr:DUF6318 family protein [Actinomycetaceae bacterium]
MTHSDESHKQPREKDLSFLDAAESFYPHFTLRHYLLVAGVVIPGLLLLPAVYHYFANHGLFPFLNAPQSQVQAAPDQPPSLPTQQQPQSGLVQTQTQSADTIMSNGYQVGPDGFLIQPKHDITPPEVPDLAHQESREGAAAFAEYFIHTYNYAWLTGDTSLLHAASAPECTSCRDMASEIEKQYGGHGWIDSESHEVTKNRGAKQLADEDRTLRRWHTLLHVRVPAHRSYIGSELGSFDEKQLQALIATCWTGQEWKTCSTRVEQK